MDIFGMSASVILNVIFIDLILSGDNAILIALAAKNLQDGQKKKAVLFGTAGAILLRLVFAAIIVYLLKIPFIYGLGGIMLLWIAYKLLANDTGHGEVNGGTTLWSTVKTIIIADALMSLDNVLALAGVAHGSLIAIIVGIIVSIPIIVWGSSFLMKIMNKYPIITLIGSGILAWTASGMITHDQMIKHFFESSFISVSFKIVITVGVLICGIIVSKNRREKNNFGNDKNHHQPA
ncbi:TerC family protein [Bacillus sp. RG28]|uniref:TerC family protein n=1 Tax=Gottfriedia endophytica TaxID=2820819 RepID=A0A940NF19_9BACI|nr:TerC family protein [Gottfriedia endophytica]MBP0724299.1 TerC family protein [Gottfriedia endophytica]